MKLAGFGHVTLTVSNYDECLAFYDRLMKHIGMRRYFESPFAVGWYADEYMFVIGHAAPAGDRFSQRRSGLHHLSFRARSREEVDSCDGMLKDIGAKIIFPAEPGPFWPGYYSLVCEDPDGIRIEINYIPEEGWKAVGAAAEAIARGEAAPAKTW
jgi:catechol 2,3-dioxygenase-like lactoylglutathione lyase family enzyme